VKVGTSKFLIEGLELLCFHLLYFCCCSVCCY